MVGVCVIHVLTLLITFCVVMTSEDPVRQANQHPCFILEETGAYKLLTWPDVEGLRVPLACGGPYSIFSPSNETERIKPELHKSEGAGKN